MYRKGMFDRSDRPTLAPTVASAGERVWQVPIGPLPNRAVYILDTIDYYFFGGSLHVCIDVNDHARRKTTKRLQRFAVIGLDLNGAGKLPVRNVIRIRRLAGLVIPKNPLDYFRSSVP